VRGVAAIAVALLSTACGAARPNNVHAEGLAYRSIVDPSSFVYVTNTPGGLSTTVELRSPATGRIVKMLATFGDAFTNNGLALSPDGRHVYVTLIGHRTLRIIRIDTADKLRSFIADGELPAVSPDGRLLAYGAGQFGSGRIAVRNLVSGATRSIDLTRLVGRSMDLFNGSVTWLSGGSDVVAIPVPVAVLTSHRPHAGRPISSCSAIQSRATCLVVVHVPPSGHPLSARIVVLRGMPKPFLGITGATARPRSLLLGESVTNRAIIARVTLAGASASVVRSLSLGPVLPVAFDLTGTHVLYLVGHSPPALWVAQIAPGRLVDPHPLIRNADLENAAW
jgi:hypothetical protein